MVCPHGLSQDAWVPFQAVSLTHPLRARQAQELPSSRTSSQEKGKGGRDIPAGWGVGVHVSAHHHGLDRPILVPPHKLQAFCMLYHCLLMAGIRTSGLRVLSPVVAMGSLLQPQQADPSSTPRQFPVALEFLRALALSSNAALSCRLAGSPVEATGISSGLAQGWQKWHGPHVAEAQGASLASQHLVQNLVPSRWEKLGTAGTHPASQLEKLPSPAFPFGQGLPPLCTAGLPLGLPPHLLHSWNQLPSNRSSPQQTRAAPDRPFPLMTLPKQFAL